VKILVIGSGGREHALCWKISKSHKCTKLYCAPGNGGISEVAELVAIEADDIDGLLKFAKDNRVDLTVVGPEAPLVKGVVDSFTRAGLKAFGPTAELAKIEGSKVFSKELMKRLGVPTADFKVFDDYDKAVSYLDTKKAPVVVKADGLAAGKGVVVAKSIDEAKAAVKKMMLEKAFGEAGDKIIIEDCLQGEEASIIVVSDGTSIVPMASSQDHKRVFDHDIGPNTGGMGAYSPAPVVTDALFKKIVDTAVMPIIDGLRREGKPYKGALYAGIMITDKGPMVLEFNARFGDPETQAILPRLKTDIVELIERSISGTLGGYKLEWDPRPCVSVVLASGGYPDKFEKGMEITGTDEIKPMKDVVIFHAGTRLGRRATDKGRIFITSGGRVLNVSAIGINFYSAIENCYNAVSKINFSGAHYRRDIGRKALDY
jgi:phosphoribosylamine--glycine ligase